MSAPPVSGHGAAPSRAYRPSAGPLARRAAKKRARVARLLADHAIVTSHKDLALTVLSLLTLSPAEDTPALVAVLAEAGEMVARGIARDLSQFTADEEPSPMLAVLLAEDAAREARLVLLVANAIKATVRAARALETVERQRAA